ncbi:phosphoenolpyruvate--protein phosphotransferase [Coraliomargarita sinensis]|uniref:Phosphoenolpyruvate-protein phosphotransferase n=1 Tax=Coraliomargarita sinensis TaxID=2174842 RepID=A0A317ZEW3_9BACT|nr:phosphoenolpyruvate--protein phosphotransferase [Coraliomargarita sinensis]PXA02887.1 phosphoenolpyruvate--protein phosphotransferase [Coraliomargarita sinensis]
MSSESSQNEIILEGIAASPGVAHGPALVYLQKQLDVPCYDLQESAIETELERFDQAILETRAEITSIRDKIASTLGEGEARIFDAHLLVLEDSALLEEVTSELRNTKKNIEYCYDRVAERYMSFFKSMEDEYLKERVADIRDVSRRLLHNLTGTQKVSLRDLSGDCILVSEDISPSDAADMAREKLLAFATDAGGKTSHSVIMARSLGIPAVVGSHDATKRIKTGDQILIDGHDGVIVINPSQDRLYKYGKLATERKKRDEIIIKVIDQPSASKDGVPIALMANVEGAREMEHVNAMNADGVGLFRTEGIFLRHHGYPPESVQYDEYLAVAEAAGDNPVIVRTLDIGGDKTIDDDNVKDDSSFMGFRAIRFCLENLDIFKTQIRAILRASAKGNVKIMYPMISGVLELRKANEVLESVKQELRSEGIDFDENIEVGAMVEVPSAAMIIDIIAKEVDFLSIGTNDLIQYLMAVDRLNDRVAHLYQPAHPAVLRSLKSIIDGGREAGIPVSICGEIAGEPAFAALLLGMGASSLSMTANLLPEVKYFIRNINQSEAIALVEEVMALGDSDANAKALEAFRREKMGNLA